MAWSQTSIVSIYVYSNVFIKALKTTQKLNEITQYMITLQHLEEEFIHTKRLQIEEKGNKANNEYNKLPEEISNSTIINKAFRIKKLLKIYI